MIEIEVISGIARGQHLKTHVPFISLGRAPERTIMIDDPFVSRNHGEIVLLDSGYQYRDLNSTHGTSLRREGEQHFIKQVELRAGDELSIGGTHNILRIGHIAVEGVDPQEGYVTRFHTQRDEFQAPQDRFANDSKALGTVVAFESDIMEAHVTSERQIYRALLEHLKFMFHRLLYVAVLEEADPRPRPFDFELVEPDAKVRLSNSVVQMAVERNRGIAFEIRDSATLLSHGKTADLSDASVVLSPDDKPTDQTGICIPIWGAIGPKKFLQMERSLEHGRFGTEALDLAEAMISRASARLTNLRLVEQNHRLRLNASLGVFAGMLGHDIKNYLFYSKKLSEIQNDPLAAHPGIAKGIERARKLAQGMKDLAAPGRVTLRTFSVEDLVSSIADEFNTLFGQQCRFECIVEDEIPKVTSNEDLLSRTVWNLVMNAYHSMENRPKGTHGNPLVRIRVKKDGRGRVSIGVIDNAGGIGPKTLEYIQHSFKLIADVYEEREDLIEVVNEINTMSGFTNSVGLFFTATAVNDMHGTIKVDTKPTEGSVFIIKIPVRIDGLKNLLLY